MIIKYHIYPTFTPREILTCVGDILSVGSSGSLSWQDALFFFLCMYIYYSPLSLIVVVLFPFFLLLPSFPSLFSLYHRHLTFPLHTRAMEEYNKLKELVKNQPASIAEKREVSNYLGGAGCFFFSRVRENIQRLSIRTPCRSVTDLACSRSIEAALLPCIHAGMRSVLILFCIH